MKTIYIIAIREKKNKSKFNEYILCTTTNLSVADRIIYTLSECLNKDYEAFWQKEFMEF